MKTPQNEAQEDEKCIFIPNSPPVGYYSVNEGALQIHLPKRPRWFYKHMTRILLGWEWHDIR
jgi:hypothetical protein